MSTAHNTSGISERNPLDRHDNVMNAEELNPIHISASFYDKEFDDNVEQVLEDMRNDSSTSHYFDKPDIGTRVELPVGKKHCDDDLLNEKVIQEMAYNKELYDRLRKEREQKQPQPGGGGTSLIKLLGLGHTSLEKAYKQQQKNHYINQINHNTQIVRDSQRLLNVKLEHARKAMKALDQDSEVINGLKSKNAEKKAIALNKLHDNPELTVKVKQALAAANGVMDTMSDINEKIVRNGRHKACQHTVSIDFNNTITNTDNQELMKALTSLSSNLSPVLDKKRVGNVFGEQNKAANEEAQKKFIEKLSKLFDSITSCFATTRTHSPAQTQNNM
ncbi:hypothetical protein AAFX24_27935 [Vibrio mediterranei]|uniref:hypothetical protein n=1 Tax=Vibrio mediterranei TaxID=689 RepID=UPI0038CEF37A